MDNEWYEDYAGLHKCEGLEDPNCSYQWRITSVMDHLTYLGLSMHCSGVSEAVAPGASAGIIVVGANPPGIADTN